MLKTSFGMRVALVAGMLGGLGSMPVCGLAQDASARTVATGPATILSHEQLDKLVPATVFFSGQTATVQLRNAAGVRFGNGPVLFAVKVDTGGYATSVQERYQDYLITETPVLVAGQRLVPGAYGVGFVGRQFLVMDIGGRTLFTVATGTDAGLKRPMPLQMTAQPDGSLRLYAGRDFVALQPAGGER